MGELRDGLYRISTRSFCAGFVVQGGRVIQCAPILRKLLYTRWAREARWVCP